MRGRRSKKAVPVSFWRISSTFRRQESVARCSFILRKFISLVWVSSEMRFGWLTLDVVLSVLVTCSGLMVEGICVDLVIFSRRVSNSGVLL